MTRAASSRDRRTSGFDTRAMVSKGKIARGGAPARAQAVLQAALGRLGLDREIAKYHFVLHWKDVVGESIAKKSRPESLKNGLLRVRVCDSVWAQELSFHKQAIIKRLSKFVSADQAPRDMVFFVGNL